MNYEAYCYALGHTLTWFVVGFICWGIIINSWYYLSTAVSLWLARVLGDRKYPGLGGIRPVYTTLFMWRFRLFVRLLLDWRMVLQCHGSKVSTSYWEVDLTGFLPKVRII